MAKGISDELYLVMNSISACCFHAVCSQDTLQWRFHRNQRCTEVVNLKAQALTTFSKRHWDSVPKITDPEQNGYACCLSILKQAGNKTPAPPSQERFIVPCFLFPFN